MKPDIRPLKTKTEQSDEDQDRQHLELSDPDLLHVFGRKKDF